MPKKTKQIIPARKALGTDKDYHTLLDELKSIIAQGQFKFYRVYPIVHAVRAQLSWTHYQESP